MGGQGKVLFGDSLVYSKGHILGCQRLGDPKAPFHPPATMELNWEKKKKSHWVSLPPLPSVIHLILILPVEFHGKSLVAAYSSAGWGSTARWAKARGKSQGMRNRICPGQAPSLFELLTLYQCKGSPQRAPKCPSQNTPCSCNCCSPCTSKEKRE